MAETDETKFPSLPTFPTQWGEGEQERLATLKEQRIRMDELYKTKFAPEAWKSTPYPERLFRGFLPETVFEPIVSKLTPWQWGFDYGVTPEQARERMQMAETEYQELLRMQRVVTILPSIQNTLRALAIAEATILTTREELDKYFKLTRIGFTEEEQSYVETFARGLLGMSMEDLTSGEPLGLQPMTAEEFDALIGGDVPILQPNQIMSTVAFSKDIDQVVQTLRQAYPPIGGELDITKGKENILQEYINALKDMGVDVSETDSLPEMASKAFDILGAGKGWVMPTDESGLPLIDPATNEPVVYVIDDDNYAWYGQDIIAYYDEDTGNLAPLSLAGAPLLTDEQKEHAFTDFGQAAIISMWNTMHMGEQYVLNAIPMFAQTLARLPFGEPAEIPVTLKVTPTRYMPPGLSSEELIAAVDAGVTPEGLTEVDLRIAKAMQERTEFDAFDARLIEIQYAYEQDYNARQQAYIDDLTGFFKENPDWLPREEWTDPIVERWNEDWKSVFDPGYLAYQMASNIHVYVAAMASIGVTFATKNPWLGMATATAMFLPMETESLRADLIASGASYALATELSIPGGAFISSFEAIGNIPLLKAVAPQFFAGFKATFIHGLAKKLLYYGVMTPAKIGFTETFLEEVPQEVMHNLIVQSVDENRHLLENIPEVIAQSLVTMAPLAFMGGGGEYLNMKRQLSLATQNQLNDMSQTFVDNGMSEDQADLLAYNYLTSTEEGMAQVQLAYEESILSQNPDSNTWTEASEGNVTYEDWVATTASSQDMISDMNDMQKHIDEYSEEITNLEKLIEERIAKVEQARELAKTKKEIRDQEEILTMLQGQLEELTIGRQKLIDSLTAMKKTVAEEPPTRMAETPKVSKLTGRVFDKMTPAERESLAVKALGRERAAERMMAAKRWSELFPPEKRALSKAFKVEQPIEEVPAMEYEGVGEEPPIEPGLDEGEMKMAGIVLPREVMLQTELDRADMATRTHPEIAKYVKLNKNISGLRERAKSNWESADEEARLAIAKRMHLGKSFIAKSWDGMSDYERGIVALDFIPDGSLQFNLAREITDMEEFLEFFEEATGLPFTAVYERSARAKNISEASKEYLVKDFSENPEYRSVLQDENQLIIATQELNARNEIQGVEHPDDALLTPEIMALVDAIQHIYDLYKPYVRYMEFMRTEAKLKALKARFPDAMKAGKESELIMALELRNRGEWNSLWQFLKGCTWGVYEYGFDPRQMAAPDLRTKDVPMGYVIGATSLNMRTRIEFPGFGKFRKNLVQRMLSYVTQMEIQWEIEPELRNFQKLWDMAYWKFENKDEIKSGLNKWWGIMQGIPSSYGWWTMQARKVWRQSMTSIFLEPVLSLRNTAQAINLHMDRTELFRFLIRGKLDISPIQRARAKRFFDIFVSQLGGLRKYVLLVGQPGLPGLDWLNRAADALNIYGWSDYLPRMWSFFAYFNKANRATTQFLKDGDVGKFLKNSGAMHLRQTERNFLLTHYLSRANDTFNLRIDGLESVTGAEMAAFYIARRNTDHTHFKYARWARGLVEMGPMGETLWNLFVFPRGYGQRVAWQAEKIVGLFKGETTWEEARGGFNDLIKLFIIAQLFSSLWKNLSGRKRNPYDPFSILTQWTFGGLFVGAMQDVTELITDAGRAVNIWGDKEQAEQAKGRLPGKLSDLSEMLVPFYRRIIDIWAAFEDTPDQDVYWLRKMREQFEEGYSAEELEKLDMTLWEKMKKATLGANPPDSDAWEKSQVAMQDSRDLLGTRDMQGRYYTLEDHAGVVSSATSGFPDIFVSDYAGSHGLDVFFKDCEAQWEEYYLLPTKPSTIRKDWRIEHPEEEAMMLFWGKLHAAALPSGETYEGILALLAFWASIYGINKFMFPKGATWRDEIELGLDLTRPE